MHQSTIWKNTPTNIKTIKPAFKQAINSKQLSRGYRAVAMEGIQIDNAPAMIVGDPIAPRNATTTGPMGPPKLTMAQLISKLEGLFLLEGTEPFRKWWEELKAASTEPCRARRVTADNEHIAKLIKIIKIMIMGNYK